MRCLQLKECTQKLLSCNCVYMPLIKFLQNLESCQLQLQRVLVLLAPKHAIKRQVLCAWIQFQNVPLLFAPNCSEKNSRNKKRGKQCGREKRENYFLKNRKEKKGKKSQKMIEKKRWRNRPKRKENKKKIQNQHLRECFFPSCHKNIWVFTLASSMSIFIEEGKAKKGEDQQKMMKKSIFSFKENTNT